MSPETTVVWITSGYPYGAGEQFIEAEISHWTAFDGKVRLLPENDMGRGARLTPPEITVSTELMNRWHQRPAQIISAIKAVLSPIWWRELRYLIQVRKLSIYRVKHAFLSVTRMMMEMKELYRITKEIGRPIDVVYSYWMSIGAFTGCLARRKGIVKNVVSRAHRTEFYEEIRPEEYTALVRQFAPEFSILAVISQDAADYAPRYGFRASQVEVSRLGVADSAPCQASIEGKLFLLSASTLTPVKQIPLMIQAIRRVSLALPEIEISWEHAGDGPLRSEVETLVAEQLNLPNLKVNLLGHLDNSALMARYMDRPVDLFINSSEHEGVPVSIMEAMMRGVPAIAPDVGAIRELVPSDLLLPKNATADDLANRIMAFHLRSKDPDFRSQMHTIAYRDYHSDSNYAAFIERVSELARSEHE